MNTASPARTATALVNSGSDTGAEAAAGSTNCGGEGLHVLDHTSCARRPRKTGCQPEPVDDPPRICGREVRTAGGRLLERGNTARIYAVQKPRRRTRRAQGGDLQIDGNRRRLHGRKDAVSLPARRTGGGRAALVPWLTLRRFFGILPASSAGGAWSSFKLNLGRASTPSTPSSRGASPFLASMGSASLPGRVLLAQARLGPIGSSGYAVGARLVLGRRRRAAFCSGTR